ncbi:MAG TPA: DUF2993 domain-containing protein [Streptosporangiaceae bacterium]|nr:DUF2993 domain-containing protein [Streptosporangiaceae bacterium]
MLSAVLVAVVLFAVALVAADRGAAWIARRRVGELIGTAWRAAAVPEVRIGGPFLIQFIGGRYREVRLSVSAFTAGGLEFGGLDATLARVRAPVRGLLAGRGFVAGEIAATVAIPFSALSERLPPGFAFRRRGADLTVHGWALAVPVTGTVEISADMRRISVNPRVAGIPSLVGFRIELPAMPQAVEITSISVADAALTVTMAGRDVHIGAAGSVDRGAVDQVRRTKVR